MRVAILGAGSSIELYPGRSGDEYKSSYDAVWALNGMAFWPTCEDIDRLYVMDDLVYRLPHYNNSELCESLKKYETSIITSRAYKDWPTSERFPIDDCVKEFGLPLGISMYSTPDFMIAHAIMEGYGSIDIFGIDNITKCVPEMTSSTAKWIGVAQGRGILVNASPGSHHMFHTSTPFSHEFGLYGYAFRPRIEQLVFAPDEMFPDNEFIEAKDGSDSNTTDHKQRDAQSSP